MFKFIMKILILFIILAFLLGGCSGNNSEQMPPAGEIPDEQPSSIDEASIERDLAYTTLWDIAPTGSTVETFGAQGTDSSEDQSFLVDCIDATYYDDNGGTGRRGYVLVCGTWGKWDATTAVTCQLWNLDIDGTPDAEANDYGEVDGEYARDPDACCVFADANMDGSTYDPNIHALIYDAYDQTLKHFFWPVTNNATGAIGDCVYDSGSDIDFDTAGYGYDVTDIAWVYTDEDAGTGHVFISVADDEAVYVHDEDGDYVTTLDDFDGKPMSIAVTKYDEDTYWWNVYIGIQGSDWNSTTGNEGDHIYCYKHVNGLYNNGAKAEDQTASPYTDHLFPGLIEIGVGKSGITPDLDDMDYGHYEGTVCAFMYATDLRGYRMRQVDFGKTTSEYYEFDVDFDIDVDGEIWAETFAVCRQHIGTPPSNSLGYLYITGSRNDDLAESFNNIRVYENDDS